MEPLQPSDPERVGVYRLLARIGAGGMGVVYLGRSPAGRAVAVKVIRPRFAADSQYRARFRREAAAARTVTPTFTAAVLDADPDAPEPWLVTAFLPGLTLRQAIAAHGALPPASTRLLAAGLAEALAAIHRTGLAHRDLKPGNIMLTPAGPHVIDFGIARPEDATAITRDGTVLGTPGFMAPEQVYGAGAGPASDVFSLGAVLAFAATGREPFGAGETDAVLARVASASADLTGIGDRVLSGLVSACLTADPLARPSPAALLDRLGTVGQHAGWLPDPVAEAIDRRAAAARLMLGPPVDVMPTSGEVMAEETVDPSVSILAPPPPPPRRVSRRALLIGGGAALAATAGLVALLSDDEDEAPGSAVPEEPRGNLDRNEPEVVWRTQVSNSITRMFAAGGTVIAAAHTGGIRALDPRTGEPVWQRDAETVTATVGDTAILVNPRGWEVSAVEAATGNPRWTFAPPYGEVSRNAVVAGDVVCFGTDVVRGIGLADGQPRWTADVRSERGFVATDGVFVGCTIDQVSGVDAATGQVRWSFPVPAQPADPQAAAGIAYVCDADGTIRAVRVADGAVLWQQPGLGSSAFLWLVADANAMYYAADGEIRAFAATTGAPLWTRPMGRRIGAADVYLLADKSTVSLAGDTLYVVSNDWHLYALNAADGRELWNRPDIASSWGVVTGDGLVTVATLEGYVEAIRPPGGG